MMDHSTPCPLRVGMIAMGELDDPDLISGMPWRMAKELRLQGIEIVPLRAYKEHTHRASLLTRAGNRILRIHARRTPAMIRKTHDRLFPGRTRRAVLRRASWLSANLSRSLDLVTRDGSRLDALFGCCISSALYELETEIPIVYFSDATSVLLGKDYPMLARRGRAFRDALVEIERGSLERVDLAIFAAPITRASAIKDLGMEETRTRVVAMGAHVTPSEPSEAKSPAEPPSRQSCDLLIVAADPVRKRVDLATRATEILRGRGINATLHVIGRGTRRSRRSGAVESVGRLSLSDPLDRDRHRSLLESCHLQLLPSLCEAFGIAPCESAHFARPSIVSSAGGLPFVILDNETGIVLDVELGPEAWGDAIEGLIDDPDRYRAMSQATLDRARAELDWSVWGQRVGGLIRAQIGLKDDGIASRRAKIG